MNNTVKQFSVLVLLLSIISIAAAQTEPVRINVRAGGPAQIVKGEIKAKKEMIYTFKAKAGQKFSGRITRQSGDASFAVTDPNGDALPEEEFDVNSNLKGSLTKTGDYKIVVNTINTQDSKYSLSIRVY